jgi:amino acid adenylation domain-containing protein
VELPLLTAAERELILVGWNQTAAEFPQQTRLPELFEARVKASPDAPAATEGPLTISYGELDQRANLLAHRLRGLNLGAEGRVALCLDRSIDLIVGLLATLKAGGVYVPLDPTYPPERLAFMLHDADATVLLTQPSVQDRLELARPGLSVVLIDESARSVGLAQPIETARPAPSANPLAYILYTSGSTGRPKGVMVGHRAIVNHLTWRQRTFPLGAGDSFLQKASCSFDISLWEIFAPLIAGARLVLARPGGQGDSAYLAQLIADEKITDVHFGPGMLDVMLDEPALARATSLRRVFCGGEPLSAAIQTRFFSRCRASLISQYGPTETTVDATWCPCDRQSAAATAPIGRPIANTRAYVVDCQLQPVPPGVAGELCLAGESLACGYLNLPEYTAEKFVPDPFSADGAARLYHTGDRCRCRPDGVIEFLGRLDAQVKIRGFRIEPGEIEAALAGHPGVRAVFVTTGQDPSGGNRLVAYVVPRSVEVPETVDSVERELRDYLGRKLPAHLVPEAFVVLEALPHLPNGKIDRQSLPAPGANHRAEAKPVAPATAAEKALARIWCEVLGVTEVSATDNFFALGGHSLLAMRIAARVRTAFQVDLPLKQLFETATLAALATVIEQLLLAHVSALSDEEARRAATPR